MATSIWAFDASTGRTSFPDTKATSSSAGMSSGSLVATTSGPRRVSMEELHRQHPTGLDDRLGHETEDIAVDLPAGQVDHRDPELDAERGDHRGLVHHAEVHEGASEPAAAPPLPVEPRAQLTPVDGASLDQDLSDWNAVHVRRPTLRRPPTYDPTRTVAHTGPDMQVPRPGYCFGGVFFLELLDISASRALAFLAAVVLG